MVGEVRSPGWKWRGRVHESVPLPPLGTSAPAGHNARICSTRNPQSSKGDNAPYDGAVLSAAPWHPMQLRKCAGVALSGEHPRGMLVWECLDDAELVGCVQTLTVNQRLIDRSSPDLLLAGGESCEFPEQSVLPFSAHLVDCCQVQSDLQLCPHVEAVTQCQID